MSLNGLGEAISTLKDTTTASFRQDVVAESMKQPVLVDFWAPWCGPCKTLGPIIEKSVNAAKGKVKLVKMNIDDHPQIGGRRGIQSIPAVIAFDKGQPVDGFVGALPESQVTGFIERLVGPLTDAAAELIKQADAALQSGDRETALDLYSAVLAEEGDNLTAIGAIAKIHVDMGEIETAKEYLEAVPDDKQSDPAIAAVRAAIDLLEQASSVGDLDGLEAAVRADPADHQARFDLAVALAAKGQQEAATDHLIEIVKRNREWNDDGARKQLLQFFEAWGPMDDMTKSGRRKLSAAIFR
jgi:putative thioredoxin